MSNAVNCILLDWKADRAGAVAAFASAASRRSARGSRCAEKRQRCSPLPRLERRRARRSESHRARTVGRKSLGARLFIVSTMTPDGNARDLE